MGTRGAYGFRLNGEDKVTYNHFDSYPSGLGCEIVEFIRHTRAINLVPFVKDIRLVSENTPPTKDEIVKYAQFFNSGVSTGAATEWYCLLRGAQGDLKPYIDGLDVMIDDQGHLSDSLFCEWAYIINLDTGRLEVYEGCNKDRAAPGRYADVEPDERGYVGVRLVAAFPLATVSNVDMMELEARSDD